MWQWPCMGAHCRKTKSTTNCMGNIRSRSKHGQGMTKEVLEFHHAVMANDVERVRQLTMTGVDLNAPWNNPGYPTMKDGSTPLICSVSLNFTEIVKILLSAGAQVNKTGGYGDSPLFKAALHGRTEMIRTLLDAGADINLANFDGLTPLNICVTDFIVHNKECAVKLLLDSGADIRSCDRKGHTALHVAAHGKSSKMVELLLSVGSNPNWTDHMGRTPLYLCMSTLSSTLYKEDMKIQLPTIRALFYAGCDMLNAVEWLLWKGSGIPDEMFHDPDEPFLQWYIYSYTNPMSLSDICRKKIQRVLLKKRYTHLPEVVKSFQLPKSLEEFISRKMCHGMDRTMNYLSLITDIENQGPAVPR
ncbi:serine/threonine-protein phosphatase 6 regulatory ankyrin repeat subunit A-like isoform X2 [Lineus longissimus]|uniref:serine/threonine-protein phosphatase 6 regulatory ankyrin repeat subunit A-like isoform X2 n=1 Tax=Lineus longissimus TaxID=88925 RepID=UPI00315DE5B5